MEDECPDIIVSIGTACNPNSSTAVEKASPLRRGVFSHGKSLYKLAKNHIALSLDSEKTWKTYMDVLQPHSSDRPRYVRLNLRLADDPPALDEVHRMRYIQKLTRDHFGDGDQIRKVALQLIASSFYFEKSGPAKPKDNHTFECKGLSQYYYIDSEC